MMPYSLARIAALCLILGAPQSQEPINSPADARSERASADATSSFDPRGSGQLNSTASDRRAARVKELQTALQEARKAVSEQPESPDAHVSLAEALLNAAPLDLDARTRNEQTTAARDEYLKAISLRRDSADAYLGLANAYGMLNQIQCKRDALRKAIWLQPSYVEPYVQLGRSFVSDARGRPGSRAEMVDTNRAVFLFERALQLKPNDGPALLGLSTAYSELRRLPEAVAILQQAITLDPEDGIARCQLADFLAKSGDAAGAVAQYRAVLEIIRRLEEAPASSEGPESAQLSSLKFGVGLVRFTLRGRFPGVVE